MDHQGIFQRQAIRAAVRIHQYLCAPGSQARHMALPQSRWQEVDASLRRLCFAQERAWSAASQYLVTDMEYQLRRLTAELDTLRGRLPQMTISQTISQPSAIAGDLLALQQEFDAVDIDLKAKRICATTAEIELEEVHLGAFQIVLHWERIGAGRAYDVIAVDPNHPVGRKDVTHPHVEDDQLCEGAGAPAIRAALAAGRLFDVFVLVRQILETYNGNSAYVALSDWSGNDDITCADCGCCVSFEDCGHCERCEARVCSDCESTCTDCGRYLCCECCSLCSKCSQSFCHTCLNEAAGRQQLICDGCLSREEDNSQHGQNEQSATETDAVRLGEAAVPA